MKLLLAAFILSIVGNMSEGTFLTYRLFHCTHHSKNVVEERLKKSTPFQCTHSLQQYFAEEYSFEPSYQFIPSEKKTLLPSNTAVILELHATTNSAPVTGYENTVSEDFSTPVMKEALTTIAKETTMVNREGPSPSTAYEEIKSQNVSTSIATELVTTIGKTTKVSSQTSGSPSDYTILPTSSTTTFTEESSMTMTDKHHNSIHSTELSSMSASATTVNPETTLVTTTENVPSSEASSTLSVTSSKSTPFTSTSSETKIVTTTEIVHSSQAPTTSTVSSTQGYESQQCPINMVYSSVCTCQGTCQSPQTSCDAFLTCSGSSCICPNGFLMQGETCIPEQECGCFFEGSVLPADSVAVDSVCSMQCACTNDALVCDQTYQCDQFATCEADIYGMMGCRCNQGYYGDGLNCQTEPTDCFDLYNSGTTSNGIYSIKPVGLGGAAFDAHCDMTSPEGPWLIIQRRTDGSTGFNRAWTVYQEKIPATGSEFWIGNEYLFYLTNQKQYELRIDFTNAEGSSFYVTYDHFVIGDSQTNYQLTSLGTHGGDAVDALRSAEGHAFSTFDADNRGWSDAMCDWQRNGGWWYRPGEGDQCFASNLNGDWYGTTNTGITWGKETLIKSVEMKLRSKQ